MTTTVRAADAAEFLSVIPRMLGYHPRRSLVLIPFRGSRSLGAMRFDLPGGEPDAIDRVASTVIGMVCRLPEADAVATIAYTDDTFARTGGMPHADLADALERRAEACGLRLTDALCVAGDGWGSYLDAACPDEGRPLAQLASAPGPATLPEPRGDQSSGAELPSTDLAERERVARALGSLEEAVRVLCGGAGVGGSTGEDSDAAITGRDAAGAVAAVSVDAPAGEASGDQEPGRVDPRALAAVCLLDDLPGFYEDALTWDADALDPFRAAALAWCLSRPSLRDVALVQWSGDLDSGDEALDAQLRWESGEEYPPDLAMRMWGEGSRPDADRLQSALRLTRRVAAAAPRAFRPGPLAMCAWLSWALGGSTHAEAYASHARQIDPEHGLSEIVLSFVLAGHLPDWAFQRGSRA